VRHAQAQSDAESRQLYKLLKIGLAIEVPLVVLTATSAVLAGSAALVALAAQSGVALVINGFAVYAMRQVLRENVYTHPYGAGKLENFSAFLCGALYVPSGLFVLYDSIERLIDAPEVGYITGLIPVVCTFVSGTILFTMSQRLKKRTADPSPLLIAYKADYFIGMCTDGGVLVAFVLGSLLVSRGYAAIGDRIDPTIALVMAVYMLYVGQDLVRHNFRALMDLPLAERDQLAITRVLAHHYADYDEVGVVFTRQSGNRRYVEIELGFDGEKTVEHVHNLSRHMEQDLGAELPSLYFHIVPVWEQDVEREAAALAATEKVIVEPPPVVA
jgi:cation diffusion facilitator family transporter